MTTTALLDARGLEAVAKILATFDGLNADEGLTVSGCFETEQHRLYFMADDDGHHAVTGAGPK